MSSPLVTIVVVPRETFGFALASLESIYARTAPPFRLVYVDAGSPRRVRRALEAASRERGFRLIRREHYLSPNQARNLGVREVDTRYVVFLDNDVVVTPGWLEPLVERAEGSGAWIVGPIYLLGPPEAELVHMAGGDAAIHEERGGRYFHERHRSMRRSLSEVSATLVPGTCELTEFHCMLVRAEALRRLGPLDEELRSAMEHIDLCLLARAAGGEVYFEPRSVIAYLPPPPLAWSDVPYLLLRWSEGWNRASLEHFRAKWRLAADDPTIPWQLAWLADRRRVALGRLDRVLRAVLGERRSRWVARRLTTGLGRVVKRPVRAARDAKPVDPRSIVLPEAHGGS
ncbi:MAG TPA: glycosyltransferase [Candidatus Bathyarchaeia archaeon]|nr:glycosyltransferase [Candidatus Bathyarchaeia archaeon]